MPTWLPSRPAARRRVHKLPLIAACLLAVIIALPLSGCFSLPDTPQVAASVNSQQVLESDVTDYIEGFRSQSEDCESDEGWAKMLKSNGYTAETMRTYILDTVFVPQEIIRQQCKERTIAVTDAELDSVIESEKAYYEQRYGAGTWESVLASFGYTADTWRENESDRLLEERLRDAVIGQVDPTEGQLLSYARENAYGYSGKHSYYLSFTSDADARRAIAKLRKNAKGKEVTTKMVRSLKGSVAVNAGWSGLESDRDSLSSDYIAALNDLKPGTLSQPVQQGDQWVVIFCDKTFSADKDDDTLELSDIPKKIRKQLAADASDDLAADEFSDWMDGQRKAADISYADMPDGLSYDVNVAVVEEDD